EGMELTPEQARKLSTTLVDRLADLHEVDIEAAGLTDLGKGAGYVERQITGWTSRYRAAMTDDITAETRAHGDLTMDWLAAHLPDDVATTVIHNDFRFDNLVLDADDPTQIVAVLDWEMATLGDPLMDLGGTMAYWVTDDDDEFFRQFRRQPTNLPGMFSRAEFVERYCAAMGFEMTPEAWRFYEVYGLFRLAGISQQIYYRYFHGQTSNEAYARFGPAATYLLARCAQILA
ncbi:MAG: putative phosphotransferase, partial [Nocardioidaceae bacterium]|nr:putative phosphotransferase [Nocardioidaceae bacterium]